MCYSLEVIVEGKGITQFRRTRRCYSIYISDKCGSLSSPLVNMDASLGQVTAAGAQHRQHVSFIHLAMLSNSRMISFHEFLFCRQALPSNCKNGLNNLVSRYKARNLLPRWMRLTRFAKYERISPSR